MDRVETTANKSSTIYRWLGLGAVIAFVLGVALPMGPHVLKHGRFVAGVAAGNRGPLAKVAYQYIEAWDSVQAKVDVLKHSEEENAKLRLELARTKHELEAVKFEKAARKTASVTHELKRKLKDQTGTHVGRTIAGITYRPPGNLMPSGLHTLGVSYFKGHDNEKAAVIFSELTNLEDNGTYKNPKMYLMTGVAFFRMENYQAADEYFDRVLKSEQESPKSEDERYQAQARLWKALIAKKLHKETKVQFWLKDLLDNHPKAQETEWINPATSGGGAHRGVASGHDTSHGTSQGEAHEQGHAQEHAPVHEEEHGH